VRSRLIVQTLVKETSSGPARTRTVVRTVTALRTTTLGFGSLNGTSTLVTLDAALTADTLTSAAADVRDYLIHEVTSPPIQLFPTALFSTGPFTSGANALWFFGTVGQVKAVAGRRLVLQHDDGRTVEIRSTDGPGAFSLASGTPDEPRMWALSFDRPPLPFIRAHFDHAAPKVTVFGNVVDATQGKAEADVPLGNGDGRSRFQTFKVPKAPVTYHLSAGATPPQTPQLEVRVNGRAWTAVDSLFGRSPDEEVYIVREDDAGSSYVQFGDGETGARLPSGVQNVTATYRTGNGAHGPGKKGADPSPGRRIEGLDKVRLCGIVTGGAGPEPADRAREAAPGRVQSLGRLVSLRDFETEVLAIPGVTTVTAAWRLVGGVPALTLCVLLEAGREAEFAAVRATVRSYQRCRGPDRFPVLVEQAFLRYIFLDLVFAYDPRAARNDVELGIKTALGLAGDEPTARTGLFGLRARRLGGKEYATRIEGMCQQVEDVSWCKVTGFAMFGATVTDPAAAALPPAPRPVAAQVVPAPNQLLQLDGRHLTLSPAPPTAPGECA
jgi:hypothetical protein